MSGRLETRRARARQAGCDSAFEALFRRFVGRWCGGYLLTAVMAWSTAVGQEPGTPPLPAPSPPGATAFVDVNVLPMDRERVLARQTVVVREGRITALGPSHQVVVPVGARRIDGRGKFLMPGLADMHTHISRYSPQSIDRALFLLLVNGVTTIRDVEHLPKYVPFGARKQLDSVASRQFHSTYRAEGYTFQMVQVSGPEMLQLREEIRAGRRWGPPRMYLSGAWHLDSTKSIEANVAAYKARGYDHIKIYRDSKAEKDSLIPAARRLGVPLVAHGKADVLYRGLRSFEHWDPYRVEGPAQLPEAVTKLVRHGLWNCPCPGMTRGTAPGALETRYGVMEVRLALGIEPAPELARYMTVADSTNDTGIPLTPLTRQGIKAFHDAGGKLLLGTDTPLYPPGYGILHELGGFVHLGLTPYEALVTGTRNVAAYAGTEDSAGTVAVGKWADLLLLNANPLDDIRHAGEIAGVMAAGRWLSRADIETRLDWYYRDVMQPLVP